MNEFVPQISFEPYFENLDNQEKYEYVKTFKLQDNTLSKLQQINFFIGENNSGKSRFIRTVMKWCKHIDELSIPDTIQRLEKYIQSIEKSINGLNSTMQIKNLELEESKANIARYKKQQHTSMELAASFIKYTYKEEENLKNKQAEILQAETGIKSYKNTIQQTTERIEKFKKMEKNFAKWLTSLKNSLYIPLLRGAKLLGEDVYLNRTEKDYQLPKKDIFTGLSIYEDLKTHLLGSYEQRELIKGFETLLSEHFFDKQTVTLIPKINADYVIVRIGNVEHPLHDLGDGIQALIVLLFPLYMRKNEDYFIFIEEPEMHLYPKWQRLFIKIIKAEFPKHQFFITTHSNVFINTADTSVYQVTRNRTNLISEVKYIIGNDKRGILADLGYQPSDILHANFIIWVEGVSDVVYIRHFIKILAPELVEYENYVFLQYGGCNNFEKYFSVEDEPREGQTKLKDINPNFWVIMDSDLEKSGQVLPPDFFKAKLKAFSNTWITEKREIENHIPKEIWEKAANNFYATNKLTMAVIELSEQAYDWDYDDRFPLDSSKKCPFECPSKQQYRDELKKNNSETPRLENVPSKTKICKEVVEIMTTEADLQKDTQLYTAMTNLVAAIRAANK